MILLIFLMFRRRRWMQLRVIWMKRKGRRKHMQELIQDFIGKECIVYTYQYQLCGTVEKVEDHWLALRNKDGVEVINLDYICRIREYPRKKNGKKKSVVF